MIEVNIKTNGEKVLDSLKKKDATLVEAALVVLRLQQAIDVIINLDFEDDFKVEEDG